MESLVQKLYDQAPLVGFLAFILYAGYKRWWVWGYQLNDANLAIAAMKAERDEWKDVAIKGAHSTAVAVKTTERAVEAMKAAP